MTCEPDYVVLAALLAAYAVASIGEARENRRPPDPPPPPDHRLITTQDHAGTRHFCLDCHATRSGVHPPPAPCPGKDAA